MKACQQKKSVSKKPFRTGEPGPAEEKNCDSNVHRIADITIEAGDDEPLWRIPRRQRSPAEDEKVSNGAEKNQGSNCERDDGKARLRTGRWIGANYKEGDESSENAGQGDKRENRTDTERDGFVGAHLL